MDKSFWNIFESHDEYDFEYDEAMTRSVLVGTVYATEDEINEFLSLWDKPEKASLGRYGANLYRHHVRAERIVATALDQLIPYEPYEQNTDRGGSLVWVPCSEREG